MQDTICAIATAAGDAGIAIIRISGSDALPAMKRVFYKKTEEYQPRAMYLGEIRDESAPIDTALGVYFAEPFSYTGEDVCELHCHGGRMPAKLAMDALIKQGVRPALPGEFSKRAFLNGKMDISQAEAVQEMIGTLTEAGAHVCAKHLRGDLRREIERMQDALTNVIAAIEAGIEYPEEALEQTAARAQLPEIYAISQSVGALAKTFDQGKLLREGINIAIAGRPNVGKSSILNAILGEERAIVTSIAGTTRDVISEYYDLRSLPVKFTDTAGIREAQDEVEQIGVARTKSAVSEASLVLFVLDASQSISQEDIAIFSQIQQKKLVVLNKTDIAHLTGEDVMRTLGVAPIEIAAKSGLGVDALLDRVFEALHMEQTLLEGVVITNSRHKFALKKAAQSLFDAHAALEAGIDLDCVSIDLSDAWRALGEITGRTLTEDIIDRIFESFCLGK